MPDGSVFPRAGRLTFVAPSLDSATGTQEFRAQFANADRLLVPGQFVRVRLTGFTRPAALAVPQRAVLSGLGRQFVYVVGAGDTVTVRDVKPGPWAGDLWIIDEGLRAGDRVVVDGVQKVAPGRPVHPVALGAAVDSASKGAPPAGGAKKGARPAGAAKKGSAP
jgi:membrane fusion protein (multidrug efflux system)